MKRTSLILLTCVAAHLTTNAQIGFQKGYFIDNADKRIDCLIRNVDWATNPTTFKYKLGETDNVSEGDIENVKEFGVADLRYVRASVDIDQTPRDMKRLDVNRFPVWKNETVFLKELVHGKGTLYHFRSTDFERFFFSVDNNPIKQLIYKEYIAVSGGVSQVRMNAAYINQLETEARCGEKIMKIRQLKYNKPSLVNYFVKYNECNGEVSKDANKAKERTVVHLKLTPGLDRNQLGLRGNGFSGENIFAKKMNARLGLEFEIVLPVNRNKWAVLFEPTFQSYKDSDTGKNVEYTSIEIPVGIRHYLFLSPSARIHLNAGAVVDQPLRLRATISGRNIVSTTPGVNGFAGVGFDYKRFSIEARYYSKRTKIEDYNSYSIDYVKSSAIIGYRIF
jgi:hypothetical protein